MWRSPVAQRSGGPEVASSNLVIPTKSPQGLFFVSISSVCFSLFLAKFAAAKVHFFSDIYNRDSNIFISIDISKSC